MILKIIIGLFVLIFTILLIIFGITSVFLEYDRNRNKKRKFTR